MTLIIHLKERDWLGRHPQLIFGGTDIAPKAVADVMDSPDCTALVLDNHRYVVPKAHILYLEWVD